MRIKGQTTIELLILLTISVLALVLVYSLYAEQVNIGNFQREQFSAKNSLQKIINSANKLVLSGPGSQTEVDVEFFEGTRLDETIISGNTILIVLSNGTELVGIADANFSGTLRDLRGKHKINLYYDGNSVLIFYKDFEVNQQSISFSIIAGLDQNEKLIIKNSHSADLNFFIQKNFSHSLVSLSTTPDYNFTIAAGDFKEINLEFLIDTTANGNYSGNLKIIGNLNDVNIEKVVNISVEVLQEFKPILISPNSSSFTANPDSIVTKSISLCNKTLNDISGVSFSSEGNSDANLAEWFILPDFSVVPKNECVVFDINFEIPSDAEIKNYDANLIVNISGLEVITTFIATIVPNSSQHIGFQSVVDDSLFANYSNSYFIKQRNNGDFIATGELDWNKHTDNNWEINGTSWDVNLLAYYKFNGKSGTTIFDSARGNDGTLTNGADINASGLWDSNSLSLDGVNDYVSIPGITINLFKPFVVSLWFNFKGFNNNFPLFFALKTEVGESFRMGLSNQSDFSDIWFGMYSGITGTANNSRIFTSQIDGLINTGADFTQGNDYINLGNGLFSNSAEGASQVSFSTWVHLNGVNTADASFGNVIFAATSWSGSGSPIWVNIDTSSGNRIRFGGRSQPADSFQSGIHSQQLNLNNWYHVVGILDFENDKIIIYVNGAKEEFNVSFGSNVLTNGTFTGSNDRFASDSAGSSNRFLNGYLDEVGIWKTKLTDEQVESLYNLGEARPYSSFQDEISVVDGLIGYYSLDEISGTTTHNEIGGISERINNVSIDEDVWTNIVLVYNGEGRTVGSNFFVYLNGDLLNNTSTVPFVNSNVISSSSISRPSLAFNGQIDEVKIYERVLTQEEIIADYNRFLDAKFSDGNIVDAGSGVNWSNVRINSDINYDFGTEICGSADIDCNTDKFNDGLIGLWHLNETSGTVAFDSVADNNGTANNQRVFTSEINGVFNTGADFSQGDDYIYSDLRLPGTGDFTVSLWTKIPYDAIASAHYPLFAQHNVTGNSIVLYGHTNYGTANGNIRLWIGEEGMVGPALNDETFHHIILKRKNNLFSLYINGSLTGEHTKSHTIGQNNFWIGRNTVTTANYHNGIIDEVAIWNRSLSDSEILELYRKGVSRLDLNVYSCSDVNCNNKTSSVYIENAKNNFEHDISSLNNSRYLGFDAFFKPINELKNYNAGYFYTTAFIRDVNFSTN